MSVYSRALLAAATSLVVDDPQRIRCLHDFAEKYAERKRLWNDRNDIGPRSFKSLMTPTDRYYVVEAFRAVAEEWEDGDCWSAVLLRMEAQELMSIESREAE